MNNLNNFTSTGAKFFAHQEAMSKLRSGQGQPIVTHVMLTDVCNHTCAFCSVQKRAGDSLFFKDVMEYLDILIKYGLKAVILSGGGNPILYKCKESGNNFNDVVSAIYDKGLEIGLITNGMGLKDYMIPNESPWNTDRTVGMVIRKSWKTIHPDTLDKLTWIRISMSGLDHEENQVFVPDVDPHKTALGFSYVAHDIYNEPADPYHGKVSRPLDLITDKYSVPNLSFEDRIDTLADQMIKYICDYNPRYLRLLPNCLEPELIPKRCEQLQSMCDFINYAASREVAFVQQKPPKAPSACYLGYIHPVLNCDGYVYPCDSCVLNEAAEHSFANPWRICHWKDIADIYDKPIRSLIEDTNKTCPGCVFTNSNNLLKDIADGKQELIQIDTPLTHANFV